MTLRLNAGLLPGILLLLHYVSFAQTETKMTIPSTPAFSILSFEPTSVMRPTSNKDFGADILNAFDKDGKLIMNLGLEVSPYWLKSHAALTEKEYLRPTVGQCFLQSFNLSAATVKDSANGRNKLGAGFRFKILNGEPVDGFESAKKELKSEETLIAFIDIAKPQVSMGFLKTRQAIIDFIATSLRKSTNPVYSSQAITEFKNRASQQSSLFSDSNEDLVEFIEALKKVRYDANGELIKKVAELTKKRKGLIIEFAGASSFVTSGSNAFDRAGLWANVSNYFTATDACTFTCRYLFSNNDSSLRNFDAGLSYIKEMPKFNITIEGMLRWFRAEIPDMSISGSPIKRVEKDFAYRIAAQGSFRISNDISINLSLGKDFDSPFIASDGYFSILGLNYSLFSKEKVKVGP